MKPKMSEEALKFMHTECEESYNKGVIDGAIHSIETVLESVKHVKRSVCVFNLRSQLNTYIKELEDLKVK